MVVVVVSAAMLGASSDVLAATGFFDPDDYDTPARSDIASADLDDDGDDDLVSVGYGQLAVHLSDGEGGFGAVTHFPITPGDDAWLAVDDLDGDGSPDAVVSPRVARKLLVLYGDGLGGFEPAIQVATTTGWGDVVIGSFGGDGAKDIAALDGTGESIETFVQGAEREFLSGDTIELGDGFLTALGAADLDGDARTDLVGVHSDTGDVSIVLQEPDGFTDPVRRAVGEQPRDVAVADFDGEGGLDIATADSWDGTVSILPATAPGEFGSRIVRDAGIDIATALGPWALAADDLDSDGDIDLIAPSSEEIRVLLSGGDGSFDSVRAGSPAGSPIATGHFDDDGELDLATTGTDVLFGDVLHLDWQWINWGVHYFGTSESQPVTLRNAGSQPIGTGAIGLLGSGGPFSVDVDDCVDIVLTVGETCSLVAAFTPQDGPEAYHVDLLEVAGDVNTGPRYALLEGTSRPFSPPPPIVPEWAASPGRLNFTVEPGTAVSASQGVTYTNISDEPLPVGVTRLTGDFAVGSDGCAGKVVGSGQSCVVNVVFKPQFPSRSGASRGILRLGAPSGATAGLFGRVVTPRPPRAPVSLSVIPPNLELLRKAVRKRIRGGPRRVLRLPSFVPPVGGVLRLGISTTKRGKRIVMASASERLLPVQKIQLGFRLTKRARAILRTPGSTRVRIVVSFDPEGAAPAIRSAGSATVVSPTRR